MSSLKLIGLNVAIALAYFLLGKLGLALALPPGFVSAIWPPAGLAFAACLLWRGRYVWPGILIGSTCVNASVGGSFHFGSLPFLIAIGSTLQALVGSWAVRRVDPDMLLSRPAVILRFSGVGIASALIAAAVGNASLYGHGFISADHIPQSFITWWLGDAFGIQIFAPLMLLLLDQRPEWRVRRLGVGAPLLILFFLCGLVYFYVLKTEEKRLFGQISSQLEQATVDLNKLQLSHVQAVSAMATFLETEPYGSVSQYESMAKGLLPAAPGLRNVAWGPILAGDGDEGFRNVSKMLWGAPLAIKRSKTWRPNTRLISLPITLISPLKNNEAALGFDLYSESIRAAAIEQMRASGKPAVSGVIKLVQDPNGPGGALILAPVFQGKSLVSAVSGALDLRYVETVLQRYSSTQWRLRDLGGDGNKGSVLITTISGDIPEVSETGLIDRSGVYWKKNLKFANRDWELVLYRPLQGLTAEAGLAPLLVLFMALSVCAVLANLALMLSGERQRISNEVTEKTRELRNEMQERGKAEAAQARQLENLAILNLISALPDDELEVQLSRGLEMGASMLGLACGLVSHVVGDTFTVLAKTEACPTFDPALPTPFSMTYCSIALAMGDVVAIEHMAQSRYASHPCYAAFHFETYIGAPVYVNGEVYGSVNFASPTVYERSFDEGDYEFLRLLAKWVGTSIERALAVEQLRSSKEAAEMASEAKSQFLASMSHEIRTPMNGILGMLKLLEHSELNTRQLDYTNKAQAATLALLGIINDILDFSKVEAGKMEIENNPFSINEVMHDLAVLLSANQSRQELEILFDVDPRIPSTLQGDALRLRQVLLNLTGNAIKFTGQGEVILSVRLQESDADSATLEFSVQDTGIGIEPQKLDYIFQGFSQAEASTTRRFGGTGLGLAISKNLVALMGGELRVESEVGKGSRFFFRLRLRQAVADDALTQALSVPEPGYDILIVENHPKARDVLQAMIAELGWQSHAVSSGSEAIDYLQQREISKNQVILMDLSLPGMDGWATTRKIRQLKGGGLIPVVLMVTAHGRELLAERTKNEAEQVDGYALKPLTASLLHDAIAGVMQSNSEQPQSPSHQRQYKPLAGLRLLVVEDNPLNQQVARELLSGSGAEVAIAGGGLEGVAQALTATPPFDAILMDMQMPDIDGLEACRRIRVHESMQAIPIIAMTANAMASDKQACLAAGMVDHVSKPINLDELVNAVLQHTRQGGRDENPLASSTPTAAPSEVWAIDAAGALKRLGENRDLYAQILRVFPVEADHQLNDLKKAFSTANLPDAIRALHTLKSNAGMLGATPLTTLCQHWETSLKSRLSHEVDLPENKDEEERLVQEVEQQLQQVLEQIPLVSF